MLNNLSGPSAFWWFNAGIAGQQQRTGRQRWFAMLNNLSGPGIKTAWIGPFWWFNRGERPMHFDNAVAAYTNRLREICNGNKYTADRYLDIMRYCCRQHVAEVGGSYLSAFCDAVKRASKQY
jgi:hypothetical protein